MTALALSASFTASAGTICRATNKDSYAWIQTFGFDKETFKAFYINSFDDDKRVEGTIRTIGPDSKKTSLDIKFYTYENRHTGEYEYTEFHVFNIRSEDDSRLQMFGGNFNQVQSESYINQLISSNEYDCFDI